ncbi:hypothetical protein EXIGLDRAFT_779606 [Exidia glandulosa HHB12029]|uniref:Uncharacterized protein n=1 Tax=Exidia glandulosa HHB12029 TaxID=1314781 RepID=A0A165BZJ0_EXIGL|nr:hypothetical protein EXIGLDRAFT_779606 [Exidia glandulosa HHB12029]
MRILPSEHHLSFTHDSKSRDCSALLYNQSWLRLCLATQVVRKSVYVRLLVPGDEQSRLAASSPFAPILSPPIPHRDGSMGGATWPPYADWDSRTAGQGSTLPSNLLRSLDVVGFPSRQRNLLRGGVIDCLLTFGVYMYPLEAHHHIYPVAFHRRTIRPVRTRAIVGVLYAH